ncbi:beta-lactamase family protein [Pseudonocardia kujensis]|uniref:serine hydrolase domain-containing protein n=1 Tax=Pseudonocardia kujensis TaxID=1128675 RepID=UPI001E36618C|nr:serine hydrolase domain-containing protein [Pseudonocardia kujensis]MCE0763709.1 beta-lactamase family protein [Pseudonocardia kujensis]
MTELASNIESGAELGASIVVDLDGETLLDVWGGHADANREEKWARDTIVNVWSITKTVTNLAALVLVDRGLLDLNVPVATYWPEFAANGKESVLVKHVMSHTSGVSGWDQPWEPHQIYDRERATNQLATQAPWWEPGTASGYHDQSLGHLVGELIRRVSGKSLTEFVRTELAEPLGADFQIGARESDRGRIAEIIPPPPIEFDINELAEDDPMRKTFSSTILDASEANTIDWRRSELGAANGHGNARSVARILSPISRAGVVDGVRLLSPSTIDLIFEEQARNVDLVLGIPVRWGIGFGLPEPATLPYIPDDRIAFWGGWGGSMVLTHPGQGLTISYVMNKMGDDIIGSDRAGSYITAIYRALGRK